MHLLGCKGQSLRYSPGWDYPLGCVVALYVGRDPRGNNALAQLSAGFQSLPPLSTSKVGPSGADSLGGWVGGFVYVLEPHGFLQQTLL